MTFLERYQKETTWWGKVIIMEIFHLHAISKNKDWTLGQTAEVFDCSVALVSENLKLAQAANKIPGIYNHETRASALAKLRRI